MKLAIVTPTEPQPAVFLQHVGVGTGGHTSHKHLCEVPCFFFAKFFPPPLGGVLSLPSLCFQAHAEQSIASAW